MAGQIIGDKQPAYYNSDSGLVYVQELSEAHADAGGFPVTGTATGGVYPFPVKYMRTVLCAETSDPEGGTKLQIPIADPSNPLWTGSTQTLTVTYPNVTLNMTVTGYRGERRYRVNVIDG